MRVNQRMLGLGLATAMVFAAPTWARGGVIQQARAQVMNRYAEHRAAAKQVRALTAADPTMRQLQRQTFWKTLRPNVNDVAFPAAIALVTGKVAASTPWQAAPASKLSALGMALLTGGTAIALGARRVNEAIREGRMAVLIEAGGDPRRLASYDDGTRRYLARHLPYTSAVHRGEAVKQQRVAAEAAVNAAGERDRLDAATKVRSALPRS